MKESNRTRGRDDDRRAGRSPRSGAPLVDALRAPETLIDRVILSLVLGPPRARRLAEQRSGRRSAGAQRGGGERRRRGAR